MAPRAGRGALVRIFYHNNGLEARAVGVFGHDLVRAHAVQAELAVPPYLNVADLGLLAHQTHDGTEELAHAFRRRVLLEFQRAEDLALRGRRRGEGDDEVCDAARHILPSRPTQNAGAYRGRLIGEIIAFWPSFDQNQALWSDLARQKGSDRRAGELYAPRRSQAADGVRMGLWKSAV